MADVGSRTNSSEGGMSVSEGVMTWLIACELIFIWKTGLYRWSLEITE